MIIGNGCNGCDKIMNHPLHVFMIRCKLDQQLFQQSS